MVRFLSVVIIIVAALIGVSAQTKRDLKRSFETPRVTSPADIPARSADEDASFVRATSYSYPADEFKPGVVQVGPRTTYLKAGLSSAEVVRLLGKPSATSKRNENDVVVTIQEFPRGEGRVLVAEFIKDALVRYTIETRALVAQVAR